jgi:hypothetical protein
VRAILATVAAACLVLMTSAGALARGVGGRCTVELAPAASTLPAGETTTLSGTLVCPLAEEASSQNVTIFEHTAGTRGKTVAGVATTDAGGAFHFTTEPLDANSVFSARYLRAHSSRQAIKVSATITLEGPATPQLRAASHNKRFGTQASAAVAFSGTVTALDAGARIVLQREVNAAAEQWRRIAIGQVNPDGTYTITHSFSRAGTATIRTVVRRHGQRAAVSEELTYEIVHRQNPLLTLEASVDSLPYGQAVTFSGSQAGASGTSVVLESRTHNGAYNAVAEAVTDTEGNFVFAEQTPLLSSDYRVKAGKLSSAPRFEQVVPLLSATLSAPTATVGTLVRISGSVTPASTGEVVQLQRRNASGIGYHAIASTTTDAEGNYSFEVPVSSSPSQWFRVTVARTSELAATASPVMELEATEPTPEAPASAPEVSAPAEP